MNAMRFPSGENVGCDDEPIFASIATRPDYVEFLTLPAYDQLLADETP